MIESSVFSAIATATPLASPRLVPPVLKKSDDDLFKDSTMTFGEHLEELRRALFKALLGLVAGCAVGLYFGADVVQYINRPLEDALIRYYQKSAKALVAVDMGRPLTPAEEAAIDKHGMIFDTYYFEPQDVVEAITEALPGAEIQFDVPRYRLTADDLPELAFIDTLATDETGPATRLRGLISEDARQLLSQKAEGSQLSSTERAEVVAAINEALARRDLYDKAAFDGVALTDAVKEMLGKRDMLDISGLRLLNWYLLHATYPTLVDEPHPTLVPILMWRDVRNDPRTRPQSLGVPEGFMIWLKASFITGFVLASPWVFYQLWMFVAAGLYPHEKKYVHIFLPFSLLLFLGGVYLALFWVFQPVLDFLFSNNAELGIDPDPRIGEWLSFFLMLPLGFGVAFQLPLVMLFLERIGILTVRSYLAKWKIAVLTIVILACVLTPADPVSFMFLGIPLLMLYFGGIAICWAWPRHGRVQMRT